MKDMMMMMMMMMKEALSIAFYFSWKLQCLIGWIVMWKEAV